MTDDKKPPKGRSTFRPSGIERGLTKELLSNIDKDEIRRGTAPDAEIYFGGHGARWSLKDVLKNETFKEIAMASVIHIFQ